MRLPNPYRGWFSGAFVLALLIAVRLDAAAPASPTAGAAPAPAPNSDMLLLEQESKFETEKTAFLQSNILDKILGPNQAVVIVDVEMGLESRAAEMGGSKKKLDKKSADGEDGEKAPPPPQKMLVPGVPMPKSAFNVEEDKGGEAKEQGGQLSQRKAEVKTTIKKLLITVFYDKRVPADKLQACKSAIMSLMKANESQIVFTPTLFTKTTFEQMLSPYFWVPLLLAIWLLLFLWGPLATFFRRLAAALEDKRQLIEEETKAKEETENEEEAEEDGDKDGGGDGDGEGEGEGDELSEEEEEAMKKFEPFTYVAQQNLKGLAYLLRKEEPWIIALVLSYIKPEFAKEVFQSMPPEQQARVAVESATIRQTSLEQVMAINEYIKRKIDFVLGGIENLIKILKEADKTTRENILEYLKNEKPSLYDRVREEVNLFEDLVRFPDVAIQAIVREVGTEQLSRALRGAGPEFMNKFLANMSAGAAALLKESMDYGRALTPEQVEDERRALMDLISKLENEGKINIRKKRKTGILEGEEAAEEDTSDRLTFNKPAAPEPVESKPTPVPASDPAAAAQFFQTAQGLYQAGQYAEAVQQLHYAIQAKNDMWEAYQYLGNAYYAQGMFTQALGAYERMLELNSDPTLQAWVDGIRTQMGSVPQQGAM